jgi:phage gp36-like protein
MAYSTPDQFRAIGLPAAALEEMEDWQILEFLEADAGVMDSYLSEATTLPLTEPYPAVLATCNVELARYSLLLWRGYNPETYDTNYQARAERWIKWLEGVANGSVSLPGITDGSSEDAPSNTRARVITSARRWTDSSCES